MKSTANTALLRKKKLADSEIALGYKSSLGEDEAFHLVKFLDIALNSSPDVHKDFLKKVLQ